MDRLRGQGGTSTVLVGGALSPNCKLNFRIVIKKKIQIGTKLHLGSKVRPTFLAAAQSVHTVWVLSFMHTVSSKASLREDQGQETGRCVKAKERAKKQIDV